jgi:hypothetical protein
MGEPSLEKDWIERFVQYTEGINSPRIFRLWAGISTVAGALERRVWIYSSRKILYPNLFTLLVGSPGSGKTEAMLHVEDLWRRVGKFHVAPNSVTRASLVDALHDADRKIVLQSGLMEYHSLLVVADEFGVLCPAHDLSFLSVINYIYNNPDFYEEKRRTGNKQSTEIINPQLNIIAGAQPGFLAVLLPEEAWQMGFTARLIMIYSAEEIVPDLFGDPDPKEADRGILIASLRDMAGRIGAFSWDDDAMTEMDRWAKSRCEPIPEHSKLVHYNQRRILHTLKLSMVSAMSRGPERRITMLDVNRARDWLLEAEQGMPDIFREMTQRSDSEVINELHFFMWRLWISDKKPIHESRIIHFLSHRVPSEKVLRIIELAERANYLTKQVGLDAYIPRPKQDHGVE